MLEAKNLNKEISIKKIDNETSNIKIFNNNILAEVVGEFDKNLKKIENLTNTKIFFRGNSITVKGSKDAIINVTNSLTFLVNKFLVTNSIEDNDITYSISKTSFKESMTKEKEINNVRSIDQIIKTPRRSVIPRSKKQSEYLNYLLKDDVIISLGPAGTGKSYLAVSVAVNMLMEKKVEKVILSRPAVEAGERLGFLPGDMKEKVDPYLRPLYDALYDLFGFERVQRKIDSGEIEVAPLAFMRGRTLKNSFAILDEAQNASLTQIKMFLTRIGENSKIVINGDPSQIDLVNKNQSGLTESTKILKNIKEIKCIQFDHRDVVRHPLVSKIIQAYQRKTDDKS
tara:strand:- start:541 stop:1563 length:1023 start_codon:yes stop_codon:yes gene_type:complete